MDEKDEHLSNGDAYYAERKVVLKAGNPVSGVHLMWPQENGYMTASRSEKSTTRKPTTDKLATPL